LIIPSSLAYGSTRYNSIPPYATLLFEINLLAVQ
jgi:FKBP-type peptidyl-prolyl cis-trans isomerase